MEFKIGDRVRVKNYDEMPVEARSKGMSRMGGQIGTVTDKLYSASQDCYFYSIDFDNIVKSTKMWEDVHLAPYAQEPVTYCYEFDYLDNVVVARFYEIKGEEKTEIARGHGHIIHEGEIGVAQAASYALKRIYDKVGGGH